MKVAGWILIIGCIIDITCNHEIFASAELICSVICFVTYSIKKSIEKLGENKNDIFSN